MQGLRDGRERRIILIFFFAGSWSMGGGHTMQIITLSSQEDPRNFNKAVWVFEWMWACMLGKCQRSPVLAEALCCNTPGIVAVCVLCHGARVRS
jgi:hypothetical protein